VGRVILRTWGSRQALGSEADLPLGWLRRCHQAADGLEQRHYVLVVGRNLPLQFSQLVGKLMVRGHECPETDEGSNHIDTHLDGPGRVQYRCGHDGAVFGENVGWILPVPAATGL
jgi:hypothetical protein